MTSALLFGFRPGNITVAESGTLTANGWMRAGSAVQGYYMVSSAWARQRKSVTRSLSVQTRRLP